MPHSSRRATDLVWQCGRFALPLGRKTWLMGIVNATPDSFSGDGVQQQSAIEHSLHQIAAGADILDIGGQSTRPGATEISAQDELARVLPIVQTLRARSDCDAIPLSIDTTKAAVARAVLDAGADIINDISGATFDSVMLETLAASTCGVVLMHLRGTPQTMRASQAIDSDGGDVITEILQFWQDRVQAAREFGIADNRIALDAGFGFGKSVSENLSILRRGRELRALGFPTLSGTSRKSTLGRILDDAPVEKRLFGTAATVALAIESGADIVRVHDVAAMRDVVRVADAVCRN